MFSEEEHMIVVEKGLPDRIILTDTIVEVGHDKGTLD